MKEILIVQGTNFGLKILGALAFWFVGIWLIKLFYGTRIKNESG
jgi:hypothetical protein